MTSELEASRVGISAATLIAGSASHHLAAEVEHDLARRFAAARVQRFPDGEVSVRLEEPLRGEEVILLAATAPPVNDHLVELLALADACRRADAARIVAILPYFGYARSDRRDGQRTPIMASLVAEIVEQAGIDHIVTVDLHAPSIEGFFRIPVDNMTAVPMLAHAVAERTARDSTPTVIVAPDLGAVRLANRYATMLKLPVAVCHKHRVSGTEVSVNQITGDVAGRRCIIVDDMISTGATIAEAARVLDEAGAIADHLVVATHAVLAPGALEKIHGAGVRKLLLTDTIEPRADTTAPLIPAIVSVAPLLATAIRRLLEGGSLRDLA